MSARDRRLGRVCAVLFGVSTLFPFVAGFWGSTDPPRLLGIVDVTVAAMRVTRIAWPVFVLALAVSPAHAQVKARLPAEITPADETIASDPNCCRLETRERLVSGE